MHDLVISGGTAIDDTGGSSNGSDASKPNPVKPQWLHELSPPNAHPECQQSLHSRFTHQFSLKLRQDDRAS